MTFDRSAMKLRPKTTALAIGAIVLVATAATLYLTRPPVTDKAAEPAAKGAKSPARPALTVTTTQPVVTRLPIKLAANGSIAAWQEASVGTESNGLRLAEVLVNVGDVVQRGQVLARFSDDSVQAEVAQARAGGADQAVREQGGEHDRGGARPG